MANAPLAVQIWRGVLLQDLGAVLPVNPVEVVPQSASGAGRPWVAWNGTLTFVSVLGEADLIDVREMLMLSHREPVPANIHLSNI